MRIAFIGYGEVGRILAEDLAPHGHDLRMHDRKLAGEAGKAMREHAAGIGVAVAAPHAAAVQGAELVISAVTASQAVPVAQACAPAIAQGAYFLDFNSASPGAKIRAAGLVNAAGGRYVEGAVMTSLPPYRIKVPLLLGGPDAAALEPLLASLGFAPKVASEKLGVASATKMCRSVMIKGLEALAVECLLGARRYGAEAEVLASLHGTFPDMGWQKDLPNYLVSRVAEHGRRRAAEMREVSATLEDGGIEPRMAAATAIVHDWFVDALAARGINYKANGAFEWREAVDALLKQEAGERAISQDHDATPKRAAE